MRKLTTLCCILVLLLAACGGGQTSNEEAEPEAVAQATATPEVDEAAAVEPTATPEPEPTATEAPAEEAVTTEEEPADAPVAEASCHLEDISALINLAANEALPAVASDEWQKGGGSAARINIIEYGDFQ